MLSVSVSSGFLVRRTLRPKQYAEFERGSPLGGRAKRSVAMLPVHLSRGSSTRDYFFRYLNARYDLGGGSNG